MKLILTREVTGLGAAGDIVDVADGYGRNYLVPRGAAINWTDFAGVLPRGLPVAQCVPVRREEIVIECAPFDAREQQKFTEIVREVQAAPGVYRKRFRPRREGR